MKGGMGRLVDVWADINSLPWPSFCRCIHEKSMGGRWTWEGGDAVWMDGEQEGGRRGQKGGETGEQRNIEVNHPYPTTRQHSFSACVLGLIATK